MLSSKGQSAAKPSIERTLSGKLRLPPNRRSCRTPGFRRHADKSESGVFGVRAQIPRACGPPFGCFASLRSEIAI